MGNFEFDIDISGEDITKTNGNLLLKEILEDASKFAYDEFKRRVPTRRNLKGRLKNGRTKSAVAREKRARKTAFGYEIAIGVKRIKKLREGESPEYPLFVHQGTKARKGRVGVSSLSRRNTSPAILAQLSERAAQRNRVANAPKEGMSRITPRESEFLVFKSPFSKIKKGENRGLIFAKSVQGQYMQAYLPKVGKNTFAYMQTKNILDFRGNIGI